MLPMQRVTRLPLLVSAIVTAADSAGDSEMYKKAKHTLGVVNKVTKVKLFHGISLVTIVKLLTITLKYKVALTLNASAQL